MGVEQKGCDAEREHREPKVDQMGYPNRHRRIEQHEQVAHAHVDTRSCEARVQDAE